MSPSHDAREPGRQLMTRRGAGGVATRHNATHEREALIAATHGRSELLVACGHCPDCVLSAVRSRHSEPFASAWWAPSRSTAACVQSAPSPPAD